MGRFLVKVPFYSMVNLVAERRVIPELIQDSLTPESLAREALRLVDDPDLRLQMRMDLQQVTRLLATGEDPMDRAARVVMEMLEEERRK